MSFFQRVYDRFLREFHGRWHSKAAFAVLKTLPLPVGHRDMILLSMVHHRDLLAYLVAAKSFIIRVQPSRVVLVRDPTFSEADCEVVRQHIPHVEFFRAEDFRHPELPIGGCWERLQCIAHLSKESYVVQLDADTLCFGEMSEVVAAVDGKYAFVIGEEPNQKLVTLQESMRHAQPSLVENPHIQSISEWTIGQIGLPDTTRYVRGCAGFTGFPASQTMLPMLLDFSRRMSEKIGDKWSKWGTEQVSSNFLAANSVDCHVLPYPKYCNPPDLSRESVFCHFIGSFRFVNGKYRNKTCQVVADLSERS